MYWNNRFPLSTSTSIWLIETWDVLKSGMLSGWETTVIRLIETWDVLKCIAVVFIYFCDQINRNMRCIEIFMRATEAAPESD